MKTMRKKLSNIGSSRGLILDRAILELYGFDRDVELIPAEGGLLIRPAGPELKRASNEEVAKVRETIKARYGKTFKDLA